MNVSPNRCDKHPRPTGPGDLLRVVFKKIPDTWYVSVDVPDQEKTGHYSRRSQTFANESDAKQFAAAKVAEGIEVCAGTLNPVVPKRIIAPLQIKKWLAEETNNPAVADSS
jgi:hypothetical protein